MNTKTRQKNSDTESRAHDVNLVDGIWTVVTDFTNVVYEVAPVPARAEVLIQKQLEDESGSPLAKLDGYSFGLYTDKECKNPVDAAQIEGIERVDYVHTDGAGEGWIDIIFNGTGDDGKFTFYVKEIDNDISGVVYSKEVVEVNITVTETDGVLSAEVSYDVEVTAENEIVFTNKYQPITAELPIDFVSKVLTGNRALKAGEFKFAVLQGSTTLLEGTNTADGKVEFDGVLKFNKVGNYSYTVVETSTGGNGITCDNTVYHINVAVTDKGGQLSAEASVVDVAGNSIVFTNHYNAAETKYTIRGNKVLQNKELINDEFTFVMLECNEDGIVSDGTLSYEAKNDSNGDFHFKELTFAEEGTFYYLVYEQGNTGNDHGIIYDETKFIVTVKITDNGMGELVPTVSYKVLDGSSANGITFTNYYEAKPTSAQLVGNKTLNNKSMGEGDFNFELYSSDSAWAQGKLLETVKNAANGDFQFSKIEYENVGSNYYLVKEVNGGKTIDGVIYDDMVYHVRVEILDDHRGQLYSEIYIYDGENFPQESIRFENTYVPKPTDISVDISVHKTVVNKGSASIGPEGFEFLLENIASGDTFSAKSDTAGDAVFTLYFGEEDIGNTYTFKLTEVDDKRANVKYSDVEYNVTVTISLDADNNLVAALTLDDAEVTEVVAEFENVYDYTPTPDDPKDPDNPKNPDDLDNTNDPDIQYSPLTGYNTNLALWFALLFIIGGAIITLTVKIFS